MGQRRPQKDEDERVLLFVKCKPGVKLGDEEKGNISKAIREAYSARHVPKYIFQVEDIPVTANGKKVSATSMSFGESQTEHSYVFASVFPAD